MSQETLQQKLVRYFKQYPKQQTFYVTSDGYPILTEIQAKEHQDYLNKKLAEKNRPKGEYTVHHRQDYQEQFTKAVTEQGADTPPYPEGEVTDAWKVNELKAFCDAHEIAYEKSDKKETLAQKVAEFQSEGNEENQD